MKSALGKRSRAAAESDTAQERSRSPSAGALRACKRTQYDSGHPSSVSSIRSYDDPPPPLLSLDSQLAAKDEVKQRGRVEQRAGRRYGPMIETLVRKMVMSRIRELERTRARVCQQHSNLMEVVRELRERQLELKCEITEAYTTANLLLAGIVVLRSDEDFNTSAEGAFLCIPGAEMAVSSESLREMMPSRADE